ncbi:TonB-dependent siderophore receptor [Klebsiella sp. BIGb0407]|uniref:TonB-dependent siderophore receptor n=1 Tax=Klebsiella sp. BIGb0407 TaxID=2940603 RepID=UPI00216913F3|nr:TonB-dependent receptor [Klebsiella sp. BIGb0407]MCS3433475.1 outer membrane receptor for ferric coprogen and ferric-rhodotorulic acid [Klebsiella sp. BIGb0407]
MSPSLQNSQPYRFHRTPVAAFMRIILCVPAFSLTASLMSPVYAAQVTESTHTFAIPAASLAAQLNQFAAQSGIFLASDARLTAGKSGPALKGSYLIADGFSRLLSGHGLMAEQQSDGSYSLKKIPEGDEMVVTAKVNHGSMTEDTDSYTTRNMAAATRLNLSPRETPQSVSVVTRQRMDDQNMTTLDDAMRQVTGVNVIKESSYQTRYQSRGFTMDNIQEDGISSSFQNSVAGMGSSEASAESPDLAIYDHVEILRGASGLTQGSGEPGGTVNMVRKRPTYDFRSSISAGIGSWDNYRSEADVSGPLNDDASLRGRFVGVLQTKNSFTDYVNSDRQVLFGTLAYDFTPQTTVTTGISWQKTNTVPDLYGVPMSTDYSSLNLPRSTFLGASWNNITFEKTNAFAELEHSFDNDWVAKSSVNYISASAQGKFIGIFGNGTQGVDDSGNAKLNNVLQRHNRSTQFGLNMNLSGPFELLNRDHELVLGADYQKENFSNLFGSVSNTSVVNINSWDPESLNEPTWDYTRRYQYDIYQRGVYATTRLKLADDWTAILGSRYSNFTYDSYFTNLTTGNITGHSNYKVKGKAMPYGGLLWDFAEDYTWYLSYAEIYKPQSSKDANGNFLPPVTGSNYETGIKGEFFDGALNASVALFRIIQENNALSGIDCDECYIADGRVQSQGLEAEISGQLAEGWQVYAGYTLNNSKYLEASTTQKGTNYSKHTPQHLFRLYNSYRLPGEWNKWSFGAGLTAQTDTTTNYSVSQGGYTLFNANIGYQYSKQISLSLNGNNLTDKEYYIGVANRHRGGNNFYGDPRNVMFNVKLAY